MITVKNTIPDKRWKHVPVREEEAGKKQSSVCLAVIIPAMRIFKHKLVKIVILLVTITVLYPI
jgi:hypothetical protein